VQEARNEAIINKDNFDVEQRKGKELTFKLTNIETSIK